MLCVHAFLFFVFKKVKRHTNHRQIPSITAWEQDKYPVYGFMPMGTTGNGVASRIWKGITGFRPYWL